MTIFAGIRFAKQLLGRADKFGIGFVLRAFSLVVRVVH
jgi:hypothetical protein